MASSRSRLVLVPAARAIAATPARPRRLRLARVSLEAERVAVPARAAREPRLLG